MRAMERCKVFLGESVRWDGCEGVCWEVIKVGVCWSRCYGLVDEGDGGVQDQSTERLGRQKGGCIAGRKIYNKGTKQRISRMIRKNTPQNPSPVRINRSPTRMSLSSRGAVYSLLEKIAQVKGRRKYSRKKVVPELISERHEGVKVMVNSCIAWLDGIGMSLGELVKEGGTLTQMALACLQDN